MSLIKTFLTYLKYLLGIWNEPIRYQQLYSIIDDLRAKNILEIGTWNGERALLMIHAAQQHRPAAEISYFGFDLFEMLPTETRTAELSKQAPSEAVVREKLMQTGVGVHLYKGDTNVVLPAVIGSLPRMDCIFIDGGHSLETIRNDWMFACNLMHDGTVVIFDDYWSNKLDGGAKPIVDSIDISMYEVCILPKFDVFINPTHGRLVIKFALVRKRHSKK